MKTMALAGLAVALAAISVQAPSGSTRSSPAGRSPGTPPVLNFTVTDSSATGPGSFPNGVVTMRLANRGRAVHQLQFARLALGHELAEARTFLTTRNGLPEWSTTIAGVGPVGPGETVTITTALPPGSYLLVDGLPDAQRSPFFKRGVVGEMQASGAANTTIANIPATYGVLITDRNIKFGNLQRSGDTWRLLEGRDRMTQVQGGDFVLRIESMGGQTHGIVLVKGEPENMRAYAQWLSGRRPMPDFVVSGLPVLMPNARAFLHLRLAKGSYVVFCPVSHARTGMRGFETGEFAQFVVR